MITSWPRNRNIMQLCWVVPDLHAAMATWTRTCGVGPFFVFDKVMFDEAQYRGKPADPVDVSAAMAQAGDVQIELVCQNDDRASFWRDIVPAGRTGFHHIALYCDDYDAELASYLRAGARVVFSGKMMGSPVCWVQTEPDLGFMIELITKNPIADAVFEQIRTAGHGWDGSNPVRTLA